MTGAGHNASVRVHLDPIHLNVLGGFALSVGDDTVNLQASAQRVVAFLALHARPVRRGYVAGHLWMDADDRKAAASLRSAIWRARAGDRAIVDATTTHLSLPNDVEVDLRKRTALARTVLHQQPQAPASHHVTHLLSESPEVLPDWYEDWVRIERERFRQLRLHALEALSRNLSAEGEYFDAIETALAAVAAEPLRESAHHALIEAHLGEGNLGEALRQYRSCCELLRARLGVGPSARLRDLVARAVRHDAGRDGGVVRALSSRHT